MAPPIHLAFLWHMHQPSYREPASGAVALPWVRLHATRSYYDMAWLLDRYPDIQATFNFVPVLVEQLESYLAGERDRYFTLTQRPAEALDAAERRFLLKHFFSVAQETEIRPRTRYWSLLSRRNEDPDGARFSAQDLRDVQALFNLAWFGFAARDEFPELAELEQRGRDYSEADKARILAIQIEVIERVLPLYRRLAARQQIEITTTPYYHPILPLLVDSEHAERCQPGRPRPRRFAWPQDARAHVELAVEAHTRVFGEPPAGAWPAEGSVSPEAIGLLAQGGLRWLASDEAQLFGSLDGAGRGALYAPYRVHGDGGSVDFVFRDRTLSDLVGFTYARNPPERAVDDLLGRVKAMRGPRGDAPTLVLVALDGENPWEYYPGSGRAFLEALYDRLGADPDVTPVRVVDHLRAHPPQHTLHHLKTGSWINGDFGIWIGGAMENQGWNLLGEARLVYEQHRDRASEADREAALRHLMQAEGSDWFWWYGEPFQSQNDGDFDELFRGHLAQVYRRLGLPVPAAVLESLYPPASAERSRPPRALVQLDLSRPSTWFDWLGAGVLDLAGPNSSMYRAASWFARMRYGFDADRVCLRLEPGPGEALDLAGMTARVELSGPCGAAEAFLPFEAVERATLSAHAELRPLESARRDGDVVELAIPLDAVSARPGDTLNVSVVLLEGDVEVERLPPGAALALKVPGDDFEASNWLA